MLKKYISNVSLTNYYPDKVIITPMNSLKVRGRYGFNCIFHLFDCIYKYDGLLILNPSFNWALRSAFIKLLSLGKKNIVFFDLLLPRPYSISDNLRAFIKRFLFKFIDKFIFLHKDTSGYSMWYGIKTDKCVYVPFKANNINKITENNVGDDGYLLSCGASYRDYVLLAHSLRNYPCKTVIVLPQDKLADHHNSIIDESLFGDNVKILRHDFNADSWNRILSRCRAVVLPIRSDVIQCAGISVYLEAMAFGKPVIITEGPATRDILTEEMAAICPPDNPVALAEAIQKVWEDEEYRTRLGKAGLRYAQLLGGEDRLVKDILQTLILL